MSASNSRVEMSSLNFEGWTISTSKSHIMTKDQEKDLEKGLSLPHLPDMVFSRNSLRIDHQDGFGIHFNPVDALKTVNDHEDLVHVAMAKEWMAARESSPHIHKIIHPYDWTYTPNGYRGTLWSTCGEGPKLDIELTEQRINYEKLKEKEKILFFDDVILFEDELDDNGCSKLSVKIRVMPSGFFCLQRFYLRVDHTLIRVYDTRLFYESGNNFILREYSKRENKVEELKVPSMVLRDQNEISNHLQLQEEVTEKLIFPSSS